MAVLFMKPSELLMVILGVTLSIQVVKAYIEPGGGGGGGGSLASQRGPAAERGRLYKVIKTYYSGAFTTTANMVAKYGCGSVKSSSEEYRRVCGPWRANPLAQAPRRVDEGPEIAKRDVPRAGLRGWWRRKCCSTRMYFEAIRYVYAGGRYRVVVQGLGLGNQFVPTGQCRDTHNSAGQRCGMTKRSITVLVYKAGWNVEFIQAPIPVHCV